MNIGKIPIIGSILSVFTQVKNTKSLTELSQNIHLLIVVLLLFQNFFVTIFRYFNFPIWVTYVNLAEISVYVFAIYCFVKKYHTLSILVASYGIPIIFSGLLLILNIPIEKTLWFLLSFELIYIILIRNQKRRILYVAFCAIFFFIPGIIISYDYPENIIKFAQLFTLTLIPFLVSTFIERQEEKIHKLNKTLEEKYIKKEIYAEKLAEKNQELVVFSQIMSHDLKSPIRTISSFAQLIERDVKKEAGNKTHLEYLNYISAAASSMNALIEDLLTYSKVKSSDYTFEIIDLQEVVPQTLPLFQYDIQHKNAKIEMKNLPQILGNAPIIKTVFQNLISNGLKYQPKDLADHQPQITIWAENDQTNHHVFVADNGIGIKQEYLDNLFTPFRRFHTASEYKGTGLGMSICQRIVEKHNGEIEVHETSEKGTTFRISFPKL